MCLPTQPLLPLAYAPSSARRPNVGIERVCLPAEELRELQTSLEGEGLPAGVPLDREIFMHLIGADETGRVKHSSVDE